LLRISFGLLKTQNVRRFSIQPLQKAVSHGCPDAVDIPAQHLLVFHREYRCPPADRTPLPYRSQTTRRNACPPVTQPVRQCQPCRITSVPSSRQFLVYPVPMIRHPSAVNIDCSIDYLHAPARQQGMHSKWIDLPVSRLLERALKTFA